MSTNNIEAEYLEIESNNAWHSVYQSIRESSGRVEMTQPGMTTNEAKKIQNKRYNRYRDVNPFDHSRIVLNRGSTDYINANLVKLEAANRQYILTQGPLPDTVGHFWLMVWEQNSRAVLMLNKIIEKKQIKCHWYWPDKIGPEHKMTFTDVGLTLEYMSHEDYLYYSKRMFKLTDIESDTSREVLQFHYTTWPDFGIPSSPVAFLDFLQRVRASGALDPTVGPPVVHCSAGIGRSGTFCLVDCCLVLIERGSPNDVNVKEILMELRRYRTGLIQTPDQLQFSYQAIIAGIKRLQEPASNHNDYEEVPIFTEDQSSERGERGNTEEEEQDEDDEPPPLPPPRGESLARNGAEKHNLNTRDAAVKFIEVENQLYDKNINTDNDKINDFILSESNADRISDFTRPLPAIPNSESLQEFSTDIGYEFYPEVIEKHDSSDDNSEISVDNIETTIIDSNHDERKINNIEHVDLDTVHATSVDNNSLNFFPDEICPIEKPLPPIPTSEFINDSSQLNGIIENINEEHDNKVNNSSLNHTDPLANLSKNEKEKFNNSSKFLEQDLHTNNDFNSENNTESSALRRRLRSEKQIALAEKIQDMKRKQRESEREKGNKRLLLPIGLGVGGLCLLGGVFVYWWCRSV